MPLTQLIENYIFAKDCNRPHLLSRTFITDAELVMNVKTDEISFPATVKGLTGLSLTLVSQFAQRFENIYTFCFGRQPGNAGEFQCGWLVCMSDKMSGTVRVGIGDYKWFCSADIGLISKLVITIEDMNTLPNECGGTVFEWAASLPYPWCSLDQRLPSAPNIPALQKALKFLEQWR